MPTRSSINTLGRHQNTGYKNIVQKPTRKSSDVHLLEVLSFQDDDGQLAGRGNVAKRETDVSQLVLLMASNQIKTFIEQQYDI